MQKEITLKDIVILFLKKWKQIFIPALILAVLLGGAGAFKSFRAATDKEEAARQQENYLVKLGDFNADIKQLRADVDSTQKRQKELQDYSQNSIYHNLDSFNEAVSEIVFYVDTGYQLAPSQFFQNPDMTGDVVSAYCDAYRSAQLYKGITQIIGRDVDTKYLDELVQINRAGDTRSKDSLGNVSVKHNESSRGVVVLRAVYSDGDTAEKIANFVFNSLTANISKSVYPHKASVLSRSSMNTIDSDLNDIQQSTSKELDELAAKLKTKEAELMQKERAVPAQPSFSIMSVVKKGIIYGLIGAVVGAILTCAWQLLAFLSDSKLDGHSTVERLYNLELLGVFHNDESAKRRASLFHKLILRLEGSSPRGSNREVASCAAASLCRLVGDTSQGDTSPGDTSQGDTSPTMLLITGTAPEETLQKLAVLLEQEAGGHNLVYVVGSNILNCGKTVDKLAVAGAVVLVEEAGKSLIPGITQEILRIEKLGKPILGILVVE